MDFRDKVVWITGASSGIGEALVHGFVQTGARVILSARRLQELERVRAESGAAEDRTLLLPLDLSLTDTLTAHAETAWKWAGKVDILINNGGISQRGLAQDTLPEVDRRMMEINYFAPVVLTKALLPKMIAKGSGHLVAVSSISGKFGFPNRSAYAASKFALAGFYESLSLEMRGQQIPVGVTVVFPGSIKTNISLHALDGNGNAVAQKEDRLEKGMSAAECATGIMQAIAKQKPEALIGKGELMMVYLRRFLPGVFRRIASGMVVKPSRGV